MAHSFDERPVTRVKEEKSVATRRKKHGHFQTGVPLTVGTIN